MKSPVYHKIFFMAVYRTGTTAYIAKELELEFTGIEIDKQWIDIAEKRLESFELLPFQ